MLPGGEVTGAVDRDRWVVRVVQRRLGAPARSGRRAVAAHAAPAGPRSAGHRPQQPGRRAVRRVGVRDLGGAGGRHRDRRRRRAAAGRGRDRRRRVAIRRAVGARVAGRIAPLGRGGGVVAPVGAGRRGRRRRDVGELPRVVVRRRGLMGGAIDDRRRATVLIRRRLVLVLAQVGRYVAGEVVRRSAVVQRQRRPHAGGVVVVVQQGRDGPGTHRGPAVTAVRRRRQQRVVTAAAAAAAGRRHHGHVPDHRPRGATCQVRRARRRCGLVSVTRRLGSSSETLLYWRAVTAGVDDRSSA